MPLRPVCRQVLATEVSKAAVAAARENLTANGIDNVFVARMSSEEFTQAWHGLRNFSRLEGSNLEKLSLETLLIDPPRAGLDDETVQLLKKFRQIIYISCNPSTLHENLLHIQDSHKLQDFALFDQFPYGEHIECGVFLVHK